MTQSKFKGPLHEMPETTQTEFWNDSCAVAELRHAIENGAVGATSNPIIVGEVLKKELAEWAGPIKRIIATMPSATEDEITWKLIEEISARGAKLLEPIHGFRKRRKKGAAFRPDRSTLLPRRGTHDPAGRPL